MRRLRLLRRDSRRQAVPAPSTPVDDALEHWVDASPRLADDLGAGGRLLLAVLGESLTGGRASSWFGHEPTRVGLQALLVALDEDPGAADGLCDLELGLADRRLGAVSEVSRARWSAFATEAVRDPAAARVLPGRDPLHREAEEVWRRA